MDFFAAALATRTRALDALRFHVGDVDNPILEAWAEGLFYVCLGCGTVGGVNPTPDHGMSLSLARTGTRDAIAWDAHVCCVKTEIITF
jgi:hypothetical protein